MHHTLFEERVSIFIGLNALVQFTGDVILEALGLIPPRINHLALTFLNAFISFKSLSAIHQDKFKFLHEDCQIFWVLELLLIVGDIYYSFYDDWGREFILLRLSFVCLSTFNWIFVTWIMIKYKLWHLTYQGDQEKPETNEAENDAEIEANDQFFYDPDDNASDKEDLSHAAIEIDQLNKKISVADEAEANGTLPTIDEAAPVKDPDSVEDSLSDKRSKQPSYIASFKEPVSKIGSRGHSAYHHTPIPHDDHDRDISHTGHVIIGLNDTPINKPLKLQPHQPSFTLTQSEVP